MENTIPSGFNNGTTCFWCTRSLEIGHWAGVVAQQCHREHRLLLSFCPITVSMWLLFMIAKGLLNLQVLHPLSRSEESLLLYSCILFIQKKKPFPEIQPTSNWLELCHMATSGYRADWGIEYF